MKIKEIIEQIKVKVVKFYTKVAELQKASLKGNYQATIELNRYYRYVAFATGFAVGAMIL